MLVRDIPTCVSVLRCCTRLESSPDWTGFQIDCRENFKIGGARYWRLRTDKAPNVVRLGLILVFWCSRLSVTYSMPCWEFHGT